MLQGNLSPHTGSRIAARNGMLPYIPRTQFTTRLPQRCAGLGKVPQGATTCRQTGQSAASEDRHEEAGGEVT